MVYDIAVASFVQNFRSLHTDDHVVSSDDSRTFIIMINRKTRSEFFDKKNEKMLCASSDVANFEVDLACASQIMLSMPI